MCSISRRYTLQACQYFTWTLLLQSHDVVMAGVCGLGWGLPWKRHYLKAVGELWADNRLDGPFSSLVSRMQHSCFLKKNLTSQFICPQNTFPICLCSAFEMCPAFVDGTLNCDQTMISGSVPDPHALPWQSRACFKKQCRLKITGILYWRLALSLAYRDF